jgi:hypothetical protein
VPNQLLLEDALSTAFTHDAGVVALAKFVCAEEKLVVCQLVAAFTIIALKANLVEVFIFKLVHRLEGRLCWAFARGGKKLSRVSALPRLEAGRTKISLTYGTFAPLYDRKVAELTFERVLQ